MSERGFLNNRSEMESLLFKHGSIRGVSKATGVPKSTIADAIQRLSSSSAEQEEVCTTCAPAFARVETQRQELSRLRAANKALSLAAESYSRIFPALKDIHTSVAPALPYKPSDRVPSLVSIWTDWHLGDVTEASTINGLYEFNPRIMEQRSIEIIDHVSEQIERHMIEEVVIVSNGDMFSGMTQLHPDESTDPDRIATQARDAAHLVAARLRDLSERHPSVYFRFIATRGNHTRSTNKSPTSGTDMGLSWEMLYYELVKALGPKTFVYHSEAAYRTYFEVGGAWGVAAHGHHFMGGGGNTHIPENSIKKFCEDADWALREINDNKLAFAVLGHYHRQYSCSWRNVTAFAAPSPKGPDSFGRDKIQDLTWPGYMSLRVMDAKVVGTDTLRF